MLDRNIGSDLQRPTQPLDREIILLLHEEGPRLLRVKPAQLRIARTKADRLVGILQAPIRPSQIIVRLAQECIGRRETRVESKGLLKFDDRLFVTCL